MNAPDLEFFMKICNNGFCNACDALGFDYEEGVSSLGKLTRDLNFKLFEENKNASVDNLTTNGKAFLKKAPGIVKDLIECALFNSDSDSDSDSDRLIVRTNTLNGKSFVLPFISTIALQNEDFGANIELFTYEDHSDEEFVNAHILFCSMTRADKTFFERKWTVKIEQGLYASKGYLKDVRKIPQKPEDLLGHSVIGYGDSFDTEIYKRLNWHLSDEYGLTDITPSIIISSQSVLTKAVEFNFGIGPVLDYHNKISEIQLVRILPDIKGPTKSIDFAIRKSLPNKFNALAAKMESSILATVSDLELEVVY